jgi:hypothetical protein
MFRPVPTVRMRCVFCDGRNVGACRHNAPARWRAAYRRLNMERKKVWLDTEAKRTSIAWVLIEVIVMLALIGVMSITGLMLYLVF